MSRLLPLILILVVSLLAAPCVALADPVVTTQAGALRGTEAPGLEVFLGIPYAKPPVGRLRWRAPRPVTPWRGVRSATRFAPGCEQPAPKPFGPYSAEFLPSLPFSENCLYLNVWAPAPVAKLRPVYVFIHGGGFAAGSGSVAIYNGAALARKGVVVVTLNYRLGLFGFLALPALTQESRRDSSGDYGTLDMITALKWVKANIARFGGDPDNVTVAGQSAGAISVNELLVSPLAKGLFQKAVIESGPTMGLPLPTLAQAEAAGVAIMKHLHVDSLAQMRSMSAAELMGRAGPVVMLPNLDGKVISANPESPATRPLLDVPVMAGYNSDELKPQTATTAAKFVSEVRQRYGKFANRFLALYPHATDAQATQSAAELAGDRLFASLTFWADRRTAEGERTFIYDFDHAYPDLEGTTFGAFHTAEVPYIFGTLDTPGIHFTARDHEVSQRMQAHWMAYMTHGDPGIASAVWRDAAQAPNDVMYLGDDPGMRLAVSSKARLRLLRDYVAQGGRLSWLQ